MTRQRTGRNRARSQTQTAMPPFIQRTAPVYDILSEENIILIEEAAEDILETIGVEVRHQPSLDLLRQAGMDVNGEHVRFTRGFCRKLIQDNAPREFIQHARNPEKSVSIGGNAMVLVPQYGPPFVAAHDIERHYGTLDDFETFVKLAYLSPIMHHSGGTLCEPMDIPVSKRHLHMNYALLRCSDKAFMGSVTSKENAEDTIKMCEIVFGKDFVAQNCVTSNLINLNSPLVLDETMLDAAHVYAAAGQATVITSYIISGASGVTTVAGNVAQSLAEGLAGMAITQLVRPGAPVIYGFILSAMCMKTGAPIAFDESWKSTLISGQLCRRLGVPYRCSGSSSTSKVLDSQSGVEGSLGLMYAMLAGANFLLFATGDLEAGLVANFDKFVADCDMLEAAARMMTLVEVNDDELGLSTLKDVGPGGTFLTTEHTLARYKTAFFKSELCDVSSFEQWVDNGSLDLAQRACARRYKLLENYEAPALDPSIDQALLEFIKQRESVLSDSFA